jgi:hypothetical protein
MGTIEKDRPCEGRSNFLAENRVEAISPEITLSQRQFQALRLARLYAVNATMAETLAPLVFGTPS